MLTPQDDLLGHQTPGTFAVAGNGDPRFTERYWYTAHPLDGRAFLIDVGFGYYPNRGVMDAFAGVTIGRTQHNFRASRRLAGNPLETTVGPLRLEVVKGHATHRLVLQDNGSGIAFDLTFEACFPAAQEKQSRRERNGELEEDLARVAQFGRWHGWIEVAGERHTLEPSTWWGQRDRSWGIRSEMRTDWARPPMQTHRNFFWTWSMLQTQNLGVSVFMKEREPGKPYYLSGAEFQRRPDGSVHKREITGFEHEITWADDPLGQTIASAEFQLSFEEGSPRLVRLEALPARYYLKGGLYGGWDGWNHGDDRGAYAEAFDAWDLDDPVTRERARTLGDHVLRVQIDGESGIGISEYGVAAGYPRYPGPQKHAAL
ncbi:hypothetical protein PE066_05805 [Ramlibacter tataouinensis]|uniref:hypothetical protein n=1 Tax=Ramlibacter tataouinensis TaxID=94132 RepID=UPI0022F3A7AA|nr:hypothetical protein [Ramlibacter tataouinensis]WBY03050.1 hypothetical protein PE066_05805 [Ramlibacter tataouinensis]